MARRWNPAVQERFHRLLFALGHEFDGKVEGVNLPETAVGFGESGRWFPRGFTPEIYRDAIMTNMTILSLGLISSKAFFRSFDHPVVLRFRKPFLGQLFSVGLLIVRRALSHLMAN